MWYHVLLCITSSCLPRDEYCKASHTRNAVRAVRWCGVGVVAAVVRTLHLMFLRFSTFYLSEQGRAQEGLFSRCEITLIHTDTMPAPPIPDHAEDYIPRYGSTLGYISLHYIRSVTLHDITWPWHHIACHWIALHTYVILRACTYAEDTF
jgi:hypothetical protein